MNYKNQVVSKDLSLAKIKLMLISMVIVIVAKEEIKNFGGEGITYTILIISKYEILLELGGLRGIYLIILFLA